MSSTRHYLITQKAERSLASARNLRVKRRKLVARLRKKAESVMETGDPFSVALSISDDMRQELSTLSWDEDDVKKMTPQQAKDILETGFDKGQKENSDDNRTKLLDDYEEVVLKELESANKSLALLKKKYQSTEGYIEKLYDKISEMEDSSDGSEESERRIEHYRDMSESQQKALNGLTEQIQAQDRLIGVISSQEEGLIEDLQEVNDTAVSTPGPEDDELVAEMIKGRLNIMKEIQALRVSLRAKDKKYQRAFTKLQKIRKRQDKSFDLGSLFSFNELDDEADAIQIQVSRSEKELQEIIRNIMKKENTLKNKKVEDYLQEIADTYKELPDYAQDIDSLKEESKKDIKEEEDPGQESGAKTKFYKDKTSEIHGFVQKYEPQFREFIIHFLGPDIPSDPNVEKALTLANSGIIKRSMEMQKLALRYKRNNMQRSAILLPAVLYELLAKSMQAVLLSSDDGEEEEQQEEDVALYAALIAEGLTKEAISLSDAWDKTKSVGRGIGRGIKSLDKGLGVVNKAVDDAVDRQKFKRQDKGPRRDFSKSIDDAKKNLQQLVRVERDIKSQLQEANSLLEEASKDSQPDPKEILRIQEAIKEMQLKLHSVGEQKNVIEHGLSHSPIPGAMRGQEQAARSPKSDYQQAVTLMQEALPELVRHLALIPDDEKLESEILRQSDRIASLIQKLIQVGFKAKKKYPNLPPTIQAYGHMFLAIDDALDKALRSNEGLEAK